ncbi:MAG: PAS domain S-box protein [Ruminiclostridium sp.]
MVPIIFIVLFLFSIAYILLGLYVLCKNWQSLTSRLFFSLCLQLTLWSLGYAFMTVASTSNIANIWRLVACFGWCFFYSVWVDFAVLLRFENRKWMTDFRRLLFYIPALFFYILNLRGNPSEIMVQSEGLWTDVYPQNFFGNLFIIYSITCAVVGILIINHWGRKSALKRQKKQANIIVISSAIAFAIGTVMDSVLPMLGVQIFSFDIIAFSIVLPCIWYAITKYKMMFITIEVANEYILKTMNEPVILIGQDFLVKEANGAALEKTGYGEIEIKGMPITALLFDDHHTPIVIKNFFKGDVKNHETTLLKKNKEYIPCLLSGAPIFDGFKEMIGTACILYDITDRKNAENLLINAHTESEKKVHERTAELEVINTLLEEEIVERENVERSLKASEEQYKALINQYQDGILVCDSSTFQIITHNIRACQILSATDEEIEQQSAQKLLNLYNIQIMDEIQQVSITKKEIKERIHYIKTGGSELDIEYVIIPVRYNNQQYIMITFRDITEMLRLEERKHQIVRMESLGTLAGGIAHDFNNILAGIMGYTQLSLDEIDNGSNNRENLMGILALSERAKKLIKQILAFSRKTGIHLENVDARPIIEEIVTMLNVTKPSNVQINYHIRCASPYVLADSAELQQLIMNLCVNATLALQKKGGRVDIILEETTLEIEDPGNKLINRSGNFIKISVIDNGCGMEPSVKDRIFEPFYSTRIGQGGTGLGLSVVHGIVQRYGGWITVESELDKGSTFEVFLPKVHKGEDNIIKSKEEDVQAENLRILLVDDEISILHSIQKILQNKGYRVTSQSDPKEALALLCRDAQAFDLVITDQSMPQMNGNELIHEVLSIRSDMPVILCSGYCFEDEGSSIEEAKNIAFLIKPASKDEYFKAIEHVLSKKTRI